jgi:hypothetical protein
MRKKELSLEKPLKKQRLDYEKQGQEVEDAQKLYEAWPKAKKGAPRSKKARFENSRMTDPDSISLLTRSEAKGSSGEGLGLNQMPELQADDFNLEQVHEDQEDELESPGNKRSVQVSFGVSDDGSKDSQLSEVSYITSKEEDKSNSSEEGSSQSSSRGRPRSNSCSSPLLPSSMTVAVATTPRSENLRGKKNEHVVVSVEGDTPHKKERLQTLHTLMSYLSSVSIKRDPTDVFDPFMSTLSVLMRLEVEAPHVLFGHRLLQEEALVDLVKNYPNHPLLTKPAHIEKLGELTKDSEKKDLDIKEILSVIVANLICPTESANCPTIPSISASNYYDVRNLMTTLMFLRSYEAILSKALVCPRERLIGDIPQRIHVVAPQQNSVGSASSRGSHSSLLPHTENAYDPSEEIPQAFSLVCHRKGDHNTPTYILSLKSLIDDIGKVRSFFKGKNEQDAILDKFQYLQAKKPGLGSDLYSRSFALDTSVGENYKREFAIYEELEHALESISFKMFEGPTMEKQASFDFPIFESSKDIDGVKNVTFRFNGNIRESVSNLSSFDPGSNDKSLPYYDPDLVAIWRHFMANDNSALNDLFPANMFGSLNVNQKQHNLKLLLALRTCPKDIGGVYLLRDFIYTLRLVDHKRSDDRGPAIDQLYKDLFVVADDAVKLNSRSLTSKPCAAQWENGVTAMFANKKVLHYRANFDQVFKSFKSLEVSLAEQDYASLSGFFQTFFGDSSDLVANNFVNVVISSCSDEDGRYRFIKTFVNFVEFNQELALCLLLPLNIQDRVFQDNTAFTLETLLDTEAKDGHFKYLYDHLHFESAYLAELVRSYEQVLPKIVDAYAKIFPSLFETTSESPEMQKLADDLKEYISRPDMKVYRQQAIAKLIETRNSRCLIRNYFEDSDNCELPSPDSFYAKMMHRTQSDTRLADAYNKGLFPRILAYVKFLNAIEEFVNAHGELVIPREVLDSIEFNEILQDFEYEMMEPVQILEHLSNVKRASEDLLEQEWLHKKNIGRFTNQLDQYIVGCKIIKELDGLLSGLSVDDPDLLREIRILILQTVISDVSIEGNLQYDGLDIGEIYNLSDRLLVSLSEADIDVINSFNSMPHPDRFVTFLLDGDQGKLELFPFLEALKDRGISKEVLKDPLFASIIKCSMPNYHLKEDIKADVLRKSKKSLIKRKDRALALKKEVTASQGGELEESLKDRLQEVVSEKTAFLEQALASSDMDIASLNGAQIDYRINRWYDAEYVEIAKYEGAAGSFFKLSNDSVVKIEKYLRFLKYKITKIEAEECLELSIAPDVKLSFARDNGDFIISNADFVLLQKQFGFYFSDGLYGDTDRLVFERRLWLDEYIRDPIPEADKAKIQELIKQKSIFNIKTLLERHQAVAYEFARDRALEFLATEIDNLDLLLTTTNDMLMNYSATIPEKAFALELALLDRFKKEKSKYYSVSNTNLIDFPDCSFDGDNVEFTFDQIKLFMSMVGVKASYIKLGDDSEVAFGADSHIKINYIKDQDRYTVSTGELISLPNVRTDGRKLYVQMFILNLKARDEVLAKNQRNIDGFKNQVDAIWTDSSIGNKSLALRQAREQMFLDNAVAKRVNDSYIFNSDIFDELINKLVKRGCEYDKTQHTIVFWSLNTSIDGDEVPDVHEVKFNIEADNYSLSSEGFDTLSSHFDLEFDDSKSHFYFGSTSINFSCKFKSEDHILQRFSDEPYSSLTLQDIVNNKFYDSSNLQGLEDFLISSFNTEGFEKISIKRDFIFLRSREMLEELKGIALSLDFREIFQFLDSKTRVFHRQKSYGINFIEDQSSLLLDKVLKLDSSHRSFKEKIDLWTLKVQDPSVLPDESQRQDVKRFINHINMWNLTVNNLKDEIKELKLRKNLIWDSFAISQLEGDEVEPWPGQQVSWLEAVTDNKFVKGLGEVDRLVKKSSSAEDLTFHSSSSF